MVTRLSIVVICSIRTQEIPLPARPRVKGYSASGSCAHPVCIRRSPGRGSPSPVYSGFVILYVFLHIFLHPREARWIGPYGFMWLLVGVAFRFVSTFHISGRGKAGLTS